MKNLLLILLLPLIALATVTDLTSSHDTFVDSTNVTRNYGARDSYYIGNRNGDNECNALIRWDYDLAGIPSNAVITSAICTLFCTTLNSASTWYIRARLLDSAWVEGVGNDAYSFGGASWNNQGHGEACDGSTITQPDSCWGTCGVGAVPPSGGAWSTAVIDSEVVTATPDSFLVFELASGVQAQLTSGKNFGFHFFGTSTSSSQRVIIATKEFAEPTDRPKLTITWTPYVEPDPAFMKIVVTPPSAPLTDYPVLVEFLNYPDNVDLNLTFFDADSTTKLYWWPDSMSGHYLRAWVIHDWSTSPENIFVAQRSNPSYMNADSVFLVHSSFNGTWSVSRPIESWDNWTGMSFDTSGILFTNRPTDGALDSIREPSGLIYDWQESDSDKRWKWFYCNEGPLSAPTTRYDDNFLMLAYASEWDGTWTRSDSVKWDSSGNTAYLNAEDPELIWLPALSKWAMYIEDHDDSDVYKVCVMLADSLDQTLWSKRPLSVFDPTTAGTPTNWLNNEQASPTLVWNPTADTLLMFFEAFNTNSRVGLALSFSNESGDTLGLDWYLTDSTGVLNASNPMPIVPWNITNQADSNQTIPDAAVYLDGNYALFNHGTYRGAGVNIWYIGDSPRNLVYQGQTDSVHLAEVITYDTAGGNFISVYQENTGKAYIKAILRDFDSTRAVDSDFTYHFRSDKNTTPSRFLCGEVFQSGGALTMYPPQRQTGVVALQSRNSFPAGFRAEIWASLTSWTGIKPMTFISFGDTILQDGTGSQTNEGTDWSIPRVNTGYSLRLQNNAVRWLENFDGTTGGNAAGSTDATLNADTLKTQAHFDIYYTTGDSLVFWIDGLKKTVAKDATYNAIDFYMTIAQGEVAESDSGAIMHIDSLRVRKYTTANGSAVASDTLYFLSVKGNNDVRGVIRNTMRGLIR